MVTFDAVSSLLVLFVRHMTAIKNCCSANHMAVRQGLTYVKKEKSFLQP